ncbi:TPM domain-containing protein [Tannerella forsythia]|uniref:TPM domain-containing protein n=1 Tax=Tannerella forsythia TaxID=28112 RepID=UPI0015CF1012|nr:TPM domain-containing protein [Tannerella forsythia]
MLTILLWGVISPSVAQRRYRTGDVPNVQLRHGKQYVSDPENIICFREQAQLNRLLGELRDSLHIETAIVVLPAIDLDQYDSTRKFANKLFNTWGIGDKQTNRGLLIVLLTNDEAREIVFETGTGLKNELTDAVCKEIQTHHMIPLFRKQAFGEGLLAGVKEVRRVMSNRPKNNALSIMKEKNTDDVDGGISGILVILAVVVSAILFFAISYDEFKFARSGRIGRSVVSRKTSFYVIGIIAICCFPGLILLPLFVLFKLLFRRRLTCSVPCPSCRAVGAFKNIRKEFHVEFETVGNKKLRTQHWSFVCKKCGFRMKEKVYDDVSEFAMLTQNVIQTMRSNGRNRDNDDEGSWGGGHSDGGGASTRF